MNTTIEQKCKACGGANRSRGYIYYYDDYRAPHGRPEIPPDICDHCGQRYIRWLRRKSIDAGDESLNAFLAWMLNELITRSRKGLAIIRCSSDKCSTFVNKSGDKCHQCTIRDQDFERKEKEKLRYYAELPRGYGKAELKKFLHEDRLLNYAFRHDGPMPIGKNRTPMTYAEKYRWGLRQKEILCMRHSFFKFLYARRGLIGIWNDDKFRPASEEEITGWVEKEFRRLYPNKAACSA